MVGVAVLMGGIVRIVVAAAKVRSGASSLERLPSSGAGMSSEARDTQGSVS